MLTEEELRLLQINFEAERKDEREYYLDMDELQRAFVAEFPPSRVRAMSLDDYVVGKGNKTSFCYWVEWRTAQLGNIQRSPPDKFGVYFSKEKKRFVCTSKYESPEKAIVALREEIVRLLAAGERGDLQAIRQIDITPMFKGKILSLYFPEKYLNVFSEDHVDHFLRVIGLALPGDELDVLEKRQRLFEFKMRDAVMSKWRMQEFMWFLYGRDPLCPLPKSSEVPEELRKFVADMEFPSASETHPEFISLQVGESSQRQNRTRSAHDSGVIDFEEQNRRNKRVGDHGEDIAYCAERRWLEANNRHELAQKIDMICRKDSSAGYDLRSFELDGTPKHIEVKSTTSKPPADNRDVRFHLSAREFEEAQKLPNYYLFIVFDVKSKHPRIWQIRDPAKLVPLQLILQPSAYHACLTVRA
jgi:hypothetical protein